MFPADGLNREGDMSLNSEIQDAEDNARRHAMPFCPGCRKYHREGHQFCENYPLTPAEILAQQGNVIAAPRMTILEEREKTHGDFSKVARLAQYFKGMAHAVNGNKTTFSKLSEIELESTDLIFTKLARILEGNPHNPEHWIDIKGYAELVLESLK